jgi:hypothetical protein
MPNIRLVCARVAFSVVGSATPVHAQLCIGKPDAAVNVSMAASSMQARSDASYTLPAISANVVSGAGTARARDVATVEGGVRTSGYSGRISLNLPNAWVGAGADVQQIGRVRERASSVVLDVGLPLIKVTAGNGAAFCAIGSYGWSRARRPLNSNAFVEQTGRSMFAAWSLGGQIDGTRRVALLANGSIGILHSRYESESAATAMVLGGGSTVMFDNRLGIDARIAVPLGTGIRSYMWAIGLSVGLGRR